MLIEPAPVSLTFCQKKAVSVRQVSPHQPSEVFSISFLIKKY